MTRKYKTDLSQSGGLKAEVKVVSFFLAVTRVVKIIMGIYLIFE
jgi:hypothetical protein